MHPSQLCQSFARLILEQFDAGQSQHLHAIIVMRQILEGRYLPLGAEKHGDPGRLPPSSRPDVLDLHPNVRGLCLQDIQVDFTAIGRKTLEDSLD